MNRNLVWVVGSGGLLGSSLASRIDSHSHGFKLWRPEIAQFQWSSPNCLHEQFKQTIQLFHQYSETMGGTTVIWAAGSGVIGTDSVSLSQETANMERFLDLLSVHYQQSQKPSTFFLASSAGSVWGGTKTRPISEDTPVQPISDYGRNKLKQEEILIQFSRNYPKLKLLIGRISNLYG